MSLSLISCDPQDSIKDSHKSFLLKDLKESFEISAFTTTFVLQDSMRNDMLEATKTRPYLAVNL
jgi:hypothetical protein